METKQAILNIEHKRAKESDGFFLLIDLTDVRKGDSLVF